MAAHILLKLDGIEGEGPDGTIELTDVAYTVTNNAKTDTGGGGGSGKAQFSPHVCTGPNCKAAPLIRGACASGQHIATAVITHYEQGAGEQQCYETETLTDVLVSMFKKKKDASGNDIITFTLSFAKCEIGHKPQKDDGSLDAEVKHGWDLKTNKKV